MKPAEFPLLMLNGKNWSAQDFFDFLRSHGKAAVLHEYLLSKLIQEQASQRGLAVASEELQEAADARRLELELDKAADFLEYLRSSGLSLADFEAKLEADLVRGKLKSTVIPDSAVGKAFYERKLDYDQAAFSRLVLEDEGLAQEIATALREKESTFEEMARKYTSIAEERFSAGFQGRLKRPEIHPDLESAVFTAKPGALIGPLDIEGFHHIVLVREILPARLCEETKESLREELFLDWLESRLKSSDFRLACQPPAPE